MHAWCALEGEEREEQGDREEGKEEERVGGLELSFHHAGSWDLRSLGYVTSTFTCQDFLPARLLLFEIV